jgi:hypothetical protein
MLRVGNKLFAAPWNALRWTRTRSASSWTSTRRCLRALRVSTKTTPGDRECSATRVSLRTGKTGKARRHAAEEYNHAREENDAASAKAQSPSMQAGEYVREQIEHVRQGKHGGVRK